VTHLEAALEMPGLPYSFHYRSLGVQR
jgi:hypothetical protein